MACPHCLRGKSQNKDISLDIIQKLFDYTEGINSLTITGGEPSIAIDKIDMLIDEITKRNTPLYNIYCVTNGKANIEEFILRMLKLYTITIKNGGDTECNGVALSRDKFHEPIPYENELMLQGLSFFTKDKFTDFDKTGYLIPAGNAKNIIGEGYKSYDHRSYIDKSKPEILIYEDTISVQDTILVTVNGDILQDCDYAYDEIDRFKIGHVNHMDDLIKYFESIADAQWPNEERSA